MVKSVSFRKDREQKNVAPIIAAAISPEIILADR